MLLQIRFVKRLDCEFAPSLPQQLDLMNLISHAPPKEASPKAAKGHLFHVGPLSSKKENFSSRMARPLGWTLCDRVTCRQLVTQLLAMALVVQGSAPHAVGEFKLCT